MRLPPNPEVHSPSPENAGTGAWIEREANESEVRAEFKQGAVRQVKAGRAASVVAATLGMPKASLTNWVRADAKGQLAVTSEGKATTPTITPEQEEIARLRVQVARLTMERDVAKKAAAYFAQDVLQGTPGFSR